MIEESILKKCANDSEKETAIFFDSLGLECINLCFKIKADDGTEITDIDGIFLDKENKVILIYDDSKKDRDSNAKISVFFSKCKETKYEQQIYENHLLLPQYPIKILYIDKARSSNSKDANLSSLEHVLSENTAILFNDDFEYFKNLSTQLGHWARNDLYNLLNIHLPSARIEIDAIKVFIGNTPAYLYAAKPHDILRYAFVSRRRNNDQGYQRMVDFKRTKEIAEKLKNGTISGFTNSILLNSTVELEEKDNISKSHTPKNVKLIISNHFSSCKIVDGQHRLLSFTNLNEIEQSRFSLPVVLLDTLPPDEEKKMFLEINKNAKSVDPNLEYEIISDINNWRIDSDEFKIRLAVILIKALGVSSPIKNHVYFGNVGETKSDNITLKSFADVLIKFDYINTENNIFNKAILSDSDIDELAKKLRKILGFGSKILNDKEFIISNRGIELVCGFVAHLVKQRLIGDEQFDNIEDNFCEREICDFFKILDQSTEELKSQKLYGSSAYKNSFNFIIEKYNDDEKKLQINQLLSSLLRKLEQEKFVPPFEKVI